jgi:protocatechuate 3,4-dioxygenase beta subunit
MWNLRSFSASVLSTTTGTTTGTTSGACAVTPEGEIGPYFTDDSATGYNRSNILANLDGTTKQTGIPLTLKVYVYDAQNSCAALPGVQVDIWHCNALGVYSNEAVESTVGQTWLRGYQITDATGLVTFTTIVPGWYQGRTTHIHLRIRSKYSQASSTSDGTNTTQLVFPQALVNTINTSVSPYNTHGTNSTTNASDHVATTEMHGANELAPVGDTMNGYTATASIYLPITSE